MQKRVKQEILSQVGRAGLIALLTTMLAGCQVIADIFKAGVWVGVIVVVVVIGLLALVANMFKK